MPLSEALGQGWPGWKKAWLPDLERPGWDPRTAGAVRAAPAPWAPSAFRTGLEAFGLGGGLSAAARPPVSFGAQFPVPPGLPMGEAALRGAGPTVAPPASGGGPGAASPAGVDPGFLALLARLLAGLGGAAGRAPGRSFQDETGGGR